MKINASTDSYIKCVTCSTQVAIKIYANPKHDSYGLPIVGHRSRITCSRDCHKQWQLSINWEDRIGTERAEEIRKIRSEQASANNPSKLPGVAKKIGEGVSKFCKDNPNARIGLNNPFYGKKHTAEQKEKWAEDKTGKWAYNTEQKAKQTKNTPKKENHPNWNGGSSNGEYGPEFTKELKEVVKKIYNNTCRLCNATGIELDIHHIDYDKLNNSRSNLVPLCKVCHGKTNYDRQKWQTLLEGMLDRI